MRMDTPEGYVYVPIPERLLPAFCRWLPTVMEEPDEEEKEMVQVPDTQRRNLNVIDLGIEAACEIGAD